MLVVVLRTLILYIVVIISMRIMGKRQLGELQPSELVVAIMISDLASVPMQAIDIPLLTGILPVFTLIIAEVTFSFLSLKSKGFRKLLSGEPNIIIYDGKIDERELARLRFNINDLLEELRIAGCHNITDVKFAVIETSGKLSVIQKESARPATTGDLSLSHLPKDGLPCTIVSDGVLNKQELIRSGKNLKWLEEEMKKRNIERMKDIFIASLDAENNLFIQLKRRKRK